ncbi:aspartyl-phosphate phosphatase Spo0E family protein [Clostridium butyricum]
MSKKINLIVKIERLRELMHYLIIKEGNLLHSKVIKFSQDLDKLLNEYNRVVGY